MPSYWVADEDIARGIVKDLLAGQTFDVAQDPPQGYTRVKTDVVSEPEGEEEPVAEEEGTGEGDGENADLQNDESTDTENQEGSIDNVEEGPGIVITDPNELPSDLIEETVPVTVP